MSRQYRQIKKFINVFAVCALFGICQSVSASGFQLNEQNVRNLGLAYAGTATLAEDASTGYYNPAGLTRICEEQIVASGVFIDAHSRLTLISGTSTAGRPLLQGHTKPASQAFVPALHYAKRINDCWVFSFNITSPFGLRNDYQRNSIARYMATRSELRTIDFSPSLAYGFANGFSIGAGIDGIYTVAKLDANLDVPLAGGVGSPLTDGYLENTATDFSWGYHAGILYEITDCTRIGLNYRSNFKVRARGDSLQSVGFIQNVNLPTRQGVRADVTLPESLTLSLHQALTDCFALMADIHWTKWSRFRQLALRYDDGSQLITNESFRNTVRFALGGNYKVDDCWTWRAGIAFDRTPTRDATRTIRIPDGNRTWLALGGQYRFYDGLALDFGYSHIFFRRVDINETAPISVAPKPQGVQSLRGSSRTRADLFGLQLTWDIG